MKTRCPECKTVFNVTDEQLKIAMGRVHCGACGYVFNAELHLVQEGGVPDSSVLTEDSVDERVSENQTADVDVKPQKLSELPEALLEAEARVEETRKQTEWFVGTVVMMILLGFQWFYWNIPSIAQKAEYREIAVQFCSVFQCVVPLYRSPEEIEWVDVRVEAFSDESSLLRVSGSLINLSPFVQPFPMLEMSFADLTGKVIALRRFRSDEYLHFGKSMDIRSGFKPQIPVTVEFIIQEPANSTGDYQFSFL